MGEGGVDHKAKRSGLAEPFISIQTWASYPLLNVSKRFQMLDDNSPISSFSTTNFLFRINKGHPYCCCDNNVNTDIYHFIYRHITIAFVSRLCIIRFIPAKHWSFQVTFPFPIQYVMLAHRHVNKVYLRGWQRNHEYNSIENRILMDMKWSHFMYVSADELVCLEMYCIDTR